MLYFIIAVVTFIAICYVIGSRLPKRMSYTKTGLEYSKQVN